MNHANLGPSNLKVSKIGLGTVELGLPYGIGKNSLPSNKEAERILKTAVDLGITYFDTARGYGVAEERIGKSGIARLPNIVIGTKCAQWLEKGEDPRGNELEKRINREVEQSLRNLQVESLQLLQLHGGTEEQITRGELLNILRRLKEKGKVQHFGITTRNESAPLAAMETDLFATVQTAYSILDQRMSPKVLPRAIERGTGIINRSVLLKGALTQAVWQLPPELDQLKETSAKAASIAKEIKNDLPTLAIRFANSNPAISTILVGTIEPRHLRSAIKAVESDPLPDKVISQLEQLAIDDENLVDPSNWPPLT